MPKRLDCLINEDSNGSIDEENNNGRGYFVL
jgi:hypothetical protein